jgi:hypothetical protein
MEATGFIKRLSEAKENNSKVKLIFQYPASPRATIKSGDVLSVDEDSFTINEIYDGEVTYAYTYLVEIKDGEAKKETN